MREDEKLSLEKKRTVEMDEETHRRVIAEVRDKYGDTPGAIEILQEIRSDQIRATRDHKSQYGRIADALGEQNATVSRLSTDVAGLSVRTATIEIEQQKHSALLGQVKERQDSCAARITHDDDTTEIRDLRAQLHRAVTRRSTPPRGVKAATPSMFPAVASGLWSSPAGKAVLTAMAGLLVAIASALTTWATIAPSSQPEGRQRPAALHPVRSVPTVDRAIEGSDPDEMIDTLDGRKGAVTP